MPLFERLQAVLFEPRAGNLAFDIAENPAKVVVTREAADSIADVRGPWYRLTIPGVMTRSMRWRPQEALEASDVDLATAVSTQVRSDVILEFLDAFEHDQRNSKGSIAKRKL